MEKVKNALLFICLIWAVYLIDSIFSLNLNYYGIKPRSIDGLVGIVSAPFLHANLYHTLSNTIPLLILILVLSIFYPKISFRVVVLSIFFGGGLLWLLGRPSIHIGASGLIYSLAAFLVFIGIFKRSFLSILIAIIIAVAYDGLIWGVIPGNPKISWEGHLFGGMAGVFIAYMYKDRPVK